MSTQYETDFYGWTLEQAELLRSGRLSELDLANLTEEMENMGRSEKRELESRLTVLLHHLLKWQFQPALRGPSWRLTIEEQRKMLAQHLRDNPSLKSRLDQALADAYGTARIRAERETGLPRETFPATCPWPFARLADADFLPG